MLKDNILVIAPHPDDETLGCGGSILKHKYNKDKVHFLLITNAYLTNIKKKPANSYFKQIDRVCNYYKFDSVNKLNFEAGELDQIPEKIFIEKLSNIFRKIKPNKLYLPFSGDIHSDHRKTFDLAIASSKSFRHNYIKEILSYEVISETNFSVSPATPSFKANLYEDITKFMKKKLKVCNIYKTEFQTHPFPRNLEVVEALAKLRGSESGFNYAEAFMIIKEIRD